MYCWQTHNNKVHQTHVRIEDGTLGYQAAGVVLGLWFPSAAEALWLASPLYHSHLLRSQDIKMLLLLWNVQSNICLFEKSLTYLWTSKLVTETEIQECYCFTAVCIMIISINTVSLKQTTHYSIYQYLRVHTGSCFTLLFCHQKSIIKVNTFYVSCFLLYICFSNFGQSRYILLCI